MIISASRRTDIPSYYGEWFVNRLREGFVLTQNPYNHNRYYRAFLSPEIVDVIVFWTKNPIPFIKHLSVVEQMGYQYYFQFTLTPYTITTEKGLPEKEQLIDSFIEISDRIGKNRMVWRYDPVIVDENYSLAFHEKKFEYILNKLSPYTERCVISFVDSYKNKKFDMPKPEISAVSKVISDVAKGFNIEIYSCAEPYELSQFGIKHGACIDKGFIEKILGYKLNVKRDSNQRDECLCVQSIDIGQYNCCANGCSYCYAVKSEKSCRENMARHIKTSPILIGEVDTSCIITDRKCESLAQMQKSFFDL